MKKALIDPTVHVQKISSWEQVGQAYSPLTEEIPGSARVAEVSDADFEVAAPLFWVDCNDDAVADKYYYDSAQGLVVEVLNAPNPSQPTRSSGTIPGVTL